jgi:hypothetical protein
MEKHNIELLEEKILDMAKGFPKNDNDALVYFRMDTANENITMAVRSNMENFIIALLTFANDNSLNGEALVIASKAYQESLSKRNKETYN